MLKLIYAVAGAAAVFLFTFAAVRTAPLHANPEQLDIQAMHLQSASPTLVDGDYPALHGPQ